MPKPIVACIACSQPMKKVIAPSGVEIDCCDDHGIWLDVGELQAIVHNAEQAARSRKPGMFDGLGQRVVEGAATGAGWGAGSTLGRAAASALVRTIFG